MRSVFSTLLFLIICISCKKEVTLPEVEFDFRNAYVGTYACSKTCSSFVFGQAPQPETYETIEILVRKDLSHENLIIIDSDTIPIDTSGSYWGFYTTSYKYYSVLFKNQTIAISTQNGGLGGGISCLTEGTKR